MFIWRGWGILAVIILGVCIVAGKSLTDSMLGPGYWDANAWPIACAIAMAGTLMWMLDGPLASTGSRMLVDEMTGRSVLLRKKNDLFFIPMHWWGILCIGLGATILINGTPPGKGVTITPDRQSSVLR